VLAVVHDQQHAASLQGGHDRLQRSFRIDDGGPEGLSHRIRNEARVAHCRQFHDPDMRVRRSLLSHSFSQASLAHAAGTGDGDPAMRIEHLLHFAQLGFAANQSWQLSRQVAARNDARVRLVTIVVRNGNRPGQSAIDAGSGELIAASRHGRDRSLAAELS
jgi:hypothetical protein